MCPRNLFVFLATLLFCATTSAADPIWIEAENPSAKPAEGVGQGGYWFGPLGRKDFNSGGRGLGMHIPKGKIEEMVPEGGLLFGYEFEIDEAGGRQVWVRIGYEWARSSFDWRVDDGEWQTVSDREPTVNLVEAARWNELAWLKLDEPNLAAGKHTIQFRHVPVYKEDDKGNKKLQRLLHHLDAICITDGEFRPNGHRKPGVDYRTEKDKKAAEQVFQMPEAPEGERGSVKLSGLWEIARWDEYFPEPETLLEPVTHLPENMDELFWFGVEIPGIRPQVMPEFTFSHRHIYRTRVDVPAQMEGRGWVLEFQQFNMIISVFVNGRYVDSSKAHDTIWRCDVSNAVKPGRPNEIAVVLKDAHYALNPERSHKARETGLGWRQLLNLPRGMFTNSGTGGLLDMPVIPPKGDGKYAGLIEPVTLIATGPVYADDVFCKPSVTDKELGLQITVHNPADSAASITVENEVRPWSREGPGEVEKTFQAARANVPAGQSKVVNMSEGWQDPKLWWPDDPSLYVVVTRVRRGGKVVDTKHTRFGFREWGWEDGVMFTLNGRPWQFWQDFSGGDTPQSKVEHAETSGRNMIRLWGRYRYHPMTKRELFNYFDETGMVVRDCSTFDGQVANWGRGLTEKVDGVTTYNKVLFENIVNQQKQWVKGYRNHPCVLIWSLENEVTYVSARNLGQGPQYEPAIRMVGEEVMNTDPTRPVMVDGGNALTDPEEWKGLPGEIEKLRALGHLPVNGGHYLELEHYIHMRDYPDVAYTGEPWYMHKQRQVWPTVRGIPIFHGEIFYARGRSTDTMAAIGGEQCFTGDLGRVEAHGLMMKMMSEGYRYNGVSSAWHLFASSAITDESYYSAWQPVAVLCRQWNWTFGSGDRVGRTMKVFNQTSAETPIDVAWALNVDGRRVDGGEKTFDLPIGGREEFQVTLQMPEVTTGTDAELVLTARRDGEPVYRDVKPVHVIPWRSNVKPQLPDGQELYVLDPSGEARERLDDRGVDYENVATVDELPMGENMILVGRDAVPMGRASDRLWQRLVLSGARLLVLEQQHPLRYRSLPTDYETTDYTGRVAFPQNLSHPVFQGLDTDDFFCWSGDHTLYKNVYRKPSGGARSLVQCDNALAYTALSQAELGKGIYVLSQLKVCEKMETDPVASRLFDNLVAYVAGYEPVRKKTAVVLPEGSPELDILNELGMDFELVSDPLDAVEGDYGVAVVGGTPENLQVLAAAEDKVKAYTEQGGWLMFWNVTPESIDPFNELIDVNHMIRPFTREMVTLHMPRDPLAAGLSLRDVVMTTGERIDWWKGTQWRSEDAFSYVVDLDSVETFATINKAEPERMSNKMPHPRNAVNGLTGDEFWRYLYYIELDKGMAPKVDFELPREETIQEVSIIFDQGYMLPTQIAIDFHDGEEPVKFATKADGSKETFAAFEPRRTDHVTVSITEWDERGRKPVMGIATMWVKAARSEEFDRKVKPLLNIGALVRYPQGEGGIVLNQVQALPREQNPDNRIKKGVVMRTLLSNLGAVFASGKTVVVGTGLNFQTVDVPDNKYNAYYGRGMDPAWFTPRDRTYRKADFSAIPEGEQRFEGVLYNIFELVIARTPNVMMLAGEGSKTEAEKITGIPIGRKTDALFFLHTFNPGRSIQRYEDRLAAGRNPDAPVVLNYVVHYEDGQKHTVPVVWGRSIESWYAREPGDLVGASLAWSAPIESVDGASTAAYSMQWNNPRPDVAIQSVDILRPQGRNIDRLGSAAVLAITTATAGGE